MTKTVVINLPDSEWIKSSDIAETTSIFAIKDGKPKGLIRNDDGSFIIACGLEGGAIGRFPSKEALIEAGHRAGYIFVVYC